MVGKGILMREWALGWGRARLEFEVRRKQFRSSQWLEVEGWLRAELTHDAQASEVPQHREAGVG